GRLVFRAETSGQGPNLWSTDGTPGGTRLLKDASLKPVERSEYYLVPFGRTLFFRAARPDTGVELWRSDGTARGTVPLDLTPGRRSSTIEDLTVAGGRLYVVADFGRSGVQIWTTDGTARGTRALNAVAPGRFLTLGPALGNRMVFYVHDGVYLRELWVTNGTRSGTRFLRNICPGACTGFNFTFHDIEHRGRVYFEAYTPAHGLELWSTDGTPEGTRIVKDFCPGRCSSSPGPYFPLGDDLIVKALSPQGQALWRTRGTPRTTVRLTGGGLALGLGNFPFDAAAVGGVLLFNAWETVHGHELWRTDGTPAGTGLLRDIAGFNRLGSHPSGMQALGDTLLFLANDGDEDRDSDLWRSDGTAAGTTLVRRLGMGSRGSAEAGGLAFYVLFSESTQSLWRSDGTEAGTFQLTPPLSISAELRPVGGRVFFTAWDGSKNGLWVSNGTAAGTRELVAAEPGSGSISGLTSYRNRLYFTGQLPGGSRLWTSDGTPQGTVPVPSSPSATSRLLVEHAGILFFAASDDEHGTALWRTDGTAAGTRLAVDLAPGPSSPSIDFLASDGARLFVGTDEGLWVGDGTAAGTRRIHAVEPLTDGATATLGGVFYFTADEAVPAALWRSDGTEAGTLPVLDPEGNPVRVLRNGLAVLGGRLYINANDLENKLLATDGTATGTVLAKSPTNLEMLPVGGRLFFGAAEEATGYELWALDPD
ncbi:MAG TPA: hypothetical protein VEG34_13025, partial [Thermoanaerobaculia bacterium]|nr:hypothetical protein [Thermoanaerobaculia bacterium]